jgi:uncharacterized protein DUF2784
MSYGALADGVLILHFGFVLFVTLGALLLARWPRLAFVHLPAAIWGVLIEYSGGVCPLTPLEQQLRRKGGEVGYSGGFIDHYITAALYPSGLTRELQVALGSALLLLNAVLYWKWWRVNGKR